MRLLALLALLLLPGVAAGQCITSATDRNIPPCRGGISGGGAAAGPAYVGPGDLVSGATAWYGLRGYSTVVAATGTQKAINIRRASDNAAIDVLILNSGALDVATAAAHCAATTCFVTKWYDQSGNARDQPQPTAGSQPALTISCVNGRPCLSFVAQGFAPTTIPVLTSPQTVSLVANAGTTSVISDLVTTFISGTNLAWQTTAVGGVWRGFAGTIVPFNAANSTWHAAQLVAGTAGVANVDGVETSINTGAGATSTSLSVGSAANPITATMTEAGLWPGAFTAPNRVAMQANQKTFWGTP